MGGGDHVACGFISLRLNHGELGCDLGVSAETWGFDISRKDAPSPLHRGLPMALNERPDEGCVDDEKFCVLQLLTKQKTCQ